MDPSSGDVGSPFLRSPTSAIIKAGNGEIIVTGEAYESKASAQKGIESVKKNAVGAKVEDLTG